MDIIFVFLFKLILMGNSIFIFQKIQDSFRCETNFSKHKALIFFEEQTLTFCSISPISWT